VDRTYQPDKDLTLKFIDRSSEVRRLYVIILVMGVVVLCLAALTITLFATDKKELVIVEFNTKLGRYTVMPENLPESQLRVHAVNMIRQYIIDRYTVDRVRDNFRRRRASDMSNIEVDKVLKNEVALFKRNFDADTRQVHIISDQPLDNFEGGGVYEIDFNLIDTLGEEQSRKSQRAIIEYVIRPDLIEGEKSITQNP